MKFLRWAVPLGAALAVSGSVPAMAAPAPIPAASWSAAFAAMPTYGDGNASCAIDSGRRVFVTGDALTRDGSISPHSTMTIASPTGKLRELRPGYAGVSPWQVVPETNPGLIHWLGPCAYSGGRLYVLSPVVKLGTIDGVRVDLLTFVVPVGGTPRYASATPMPKMWNGALWFDRGTAYWFGASAAATDGWTGHDVFVARQPVSSIANGKGWRYLSASGWSADPASARPVMSAAVDGGVDTAFTAWRDSGGWHIVSRYGGPWGTDGGTPVVAKWTTANWTAWSRTNVAVVDPAAYLAWYHVGLGVVTYNTAGHPATWVNASQ